MPLHQNLLFIYWYDCYGYPQKTPSWRSEHHSYSNEESLLYTLSMPIHQNVAQTMCPMQRINGETIESSRPPPLPKVHVTKSPLFTVTGVNFTGALYIKDRTEERKAHICIFTCATTQALHLEVVSTRLWKHFSSISKIFQLEISPIHYNIR